MQLAADVRISRTRAGIDARHASVTHGGEDHRDHRNQNGRDHVPLAGIAKDTVGGHGRRGLNHDDAVKNEIPKSKRAAKPGSGHRGGGGSFHESGYWIMRRAEMSMLKRFRRKDPER